MLSVLLVYCNRAQHISQYKDRSQIIVETSEKYKYIYIYDHVHCFPNNVNTIKLITYRSMRQTHSLSCRHCRTSASIRVVAGWCINVVLVYVPKLFIHGVAVQRFTFVWVLLSPKITSVDELFVGFIGDHGMAPPVCHCP